MKVRLMRLLDRYGAGAACVAATPLTWVQRCFPASPPAELHRILFIKFFGLGSLLRALPMFLSVRARYPKAELEILTFAANASLLERFGIFDRILTVDTSTGFSLLRDMLARMARLSFTHYDAVVDMEFFSNFSSMLAFLTNAPIRTGFYLRRSFRERVLNRIVYYNSFLHISKVYTALARAIGASEAVDLRGKLKIDDADRRDLDGLLEKHGIRRDEKLLVVNVNASDLCLERRWPRERFAEVCRKLMSETPARALFIGTASEREFVQSAVDGLPGLPVINLAGETKLGTLAALLERAALLLANDSGPVHLADLLGTPTVALYGPESTLHYGLRGEKQAMFYLGLYCSPCLNAMNSKVAPCEGRNMCLQSIPSQDVLEACRHLLKGEALPPDRRALWNGYAGRFATFDWQSPPP